MTLIVKACGSSVEMLSIFVVQRCSTLRFHLSMTHFGINLGVHQQRSHVLDDDHAREDPLLGLGQGDWQILLFFMDLQDRDVQVVRFQVFDMWQGGDKSGPAMIFDDI